MARFPDIGQEGEHSGRKLFDVGDQYGILSGTGREVSDLSDVDNDPDAAVEVSHIDHESALSD